MKGRMGEGVHRVRPQLIKSVQISHQEGRIKQHNVRPSSHTTHL